MGPALIAERTTEIAAEYRVAYRQLQLLEHKIADTLTLLENDRRLAERRYQLARKAWSELALGEDDEFLVEEED